MNTAVELPTMLRLDQVSEILNVTPATIKYLVRRGKFPTPVRVARQLLWPAEVIRKHLTDPQEPAAE